MRAKYTLTIVAFFLFIIQINAQVQKEIRNKDVEGIYLTLEHFKKNKLTCNSGGKHEIPKIKLKQFFISPEIDCIKMDAETVFYKDSIFAIRLSNGKNYRFLNRTPFLIADTSFLYIYSNKTTKTEYKQSGPSRRAKKVPVTYYYFSTENQKNVYQLTLDNLCKYVQAESEVHSKMKSKFVSEEMLYSFNQNSGRFVLNDFLLELKVKK